MSDILSDFFSTVSIPKQPQIDWLTTRQGVPNLALGRDPELTGFALGSATVEFDRDRFDFIEPCPEARAAIIIVARDLAGTPTDLVAWAPKTDTTATLYGRATLLGAHNVLGPKLSGPLQVHRSVLGWLKADRAGVVVLDRRHAWRTLEGVQLVAEDIEHGLELRRILTAPSPTIVVPAASNMERRAA